MGRCYDYEDIVGPDWHSGTLSRDTYRPFPHPFNKGQAWYDEAIEAIKASIWDFASLDAWRLFYSKGWKACRSFAAYRTRCEEAVEDYMWETCWSEGIQLMRFHGDDTEVIDHSEHVHQGFRISTDQMHHNYILVSHFNPDLF